MKLASVRIGDRDVVAVQVTENSVIEVGNLLDLAGDESITTPQSMLEMITGGDALLYVRFHGRNAQQWWQHAERDDRYDYLYSPEELEPFAEAARRAARKGHRALLYLNNHFSAQSVANAVTLKKMLDEPVTARMPAELVERFPDLAGIVATFPRARLL